MMTYTTSFRNKLILGGVLLILIWFLLPLGVVSAIPQGNYLTEENMLSYSEDLLLFDFRAKITFSIFWEQSGVNCVQLYAVGSNPKLYIVSTGLTGTIGYLLSDLDLFEENGEQNCNKTETFTAGNSYRAYLLNSRTIASSTATSEWITANKVFKFSEESVVPQLTVLDIYSVLEITTYQDTPYYLFEPPNITINFPLDGAEITGTFEMEIDFEKATGYDKLMILFEEWHASTTCPIYGTAQWVEEYSKWFNYQSLPYFSDPFTTSTGTTTIGVSGLVIGTYNCVRCYFINETTGAISDELCPDYNIDVITYMPSEEEPIYYLPITPWQEYYTEHSERFATSTPLFTTIAGIFEPLITWIGNTALSFQGYFDPDNAKVKGAEMGNAIPVARGYLESIDNFFGGLPISAIFIFYIITALVIFVYRLVKGVLGIVLMAIPK